MSKNPRIRIVSLAVLLAVAQAVGARADEAAGGHPGAPPAPPADPKAASYSLGLVLGSQLHTGGAGSTVSVEELERGLHAGLGGTQPTDAQKALAAQFLRSARAGVADANRSQAREFLAGNAKVEGVMSTASGLQYIVIAPGDKAGASPQATDRVLVDYRTRLLDGTLVDSSSAHGGHATLNLNGGSLKGLREALMLMKPGAQWRLFMPPELGYDNSPPAGIPPGALLVFDLTFVGVDKQVHVLPSNAVPAAPAGN